MLTCKKLGQRAAFDTDKLLNVVFHTNKRYKDCLFQTINVNIQCDSISENPVLNLETTRFLRQKR